jgi:protein-tyrosine phosphatase
LVYAKNAEAFVRLRSMEQLAVDLRVASANDIPTIERYIVEATAWMRETGIRQWLSGEFTTADIASWVASRDTYVGVIDGRTLGSVRIQNSDPVLWPERTDEARYVHRLVIDRAHAGQGLGRAILAATERHAGFEGCPVMRLDCGARNHRLVRYYLDAGYTLVDERQKQTWLIARFEKQL